MTSDASRLGMCATKWELALLGMVEVLAAPGRGRMTISAGGSESPCVGIIDRVTRIAVLRRALVLLGNMAARAACRLVRTGQRIFGLVVIEPSRPPTGLFVTLAAVVVHRIAVFIVLAMARNTIIGRFSPRDFGFMAIAAGRRLVATEQSIICLRMVEGRFAQTIDVGITTDVVGMTASTLAIQGQGVSAMKALAPVDITGNQFVTAQTEPPLRIILEGEMTGAAILLEFRVSLDQLSRHYHTFPIDRLRRRRCDKKRHDHQGGERERFRPTGRAESKSRDGQEIPFGRLSISQRAIAQRAIQ